MATIPNKAEFYKLWVAGLLGNRPRVWQSLDEVLRSGFVGNVWIRNAEKCGCPLKLYDVPIDELVVTLKSLHAQDRTDIIFGESPPNENRVIQGELMRWYDGLCFFYSTLKEPMRTALQKDGKHIFGMQVTYVLKSVMDQWSYDELQNLLEEYPDCVVELSVFNVDVGVLTARNTLIWEVRGF